MHRTGEISKKDAVYEGEIHQECTAHFGNVVAVRLHKPKDSYGRSIIGMVHNVIPTDGVKIVTESGIITHSR